MIFGLIWRRSASWASHPDAARGYLAGEQDPDEDAGAGLVTVNAVPGSRWVEVWHLPSRKLVATTFSAADGSWQVADLPGQDKYRLIASDHTGTYESVIVDDVSPYVPV